MTNINWNKEMAPRNNTITMEVYQDTTELQNIELQRLCILDRYEAYIMKIITQNQISIINRTSPSERLNQKFLDYLQNITQFLINYNQTIYKRCNKYPYSSSLMEFLELYVALEHNVMIKMKRDRRAVEQRVLSVLHLMFRHRKKVQKYIVLNVIVNAKTEHNLTKSFCSEFITRSEGEVMWNSNLIRGQRTSIRKAWVNPNLRFLTQQYDSDYEDSDLESEIEIRKVRRKKVRRKIGTDDVSVVEAKTNTIKEEDVKLKTEVTVSPLRTASDSDEDFKDVRIKSENLWDNVVKVERKHEDEDNSNSVDSFSGSTCDQAALGHTNLAHSKETHLNFGGTNNHSTNNCSILDEETPLEVEVCDGNALNQQAIAYAHRHPLPTLDAITPERILNVINANLQKETEIKIPKSKVIKTELSTINQLNAISNAEDRILSENTGNKSTQNSNDKIKSQRLLLKLNTNSREKINVKVKEESGNMNITNLKNKHDFQEVNKHRNLLVTLNPRQINEEYAKSSLGCRTENVNSIKLMQKINSPLSNATEESSQVLDNVMETISDGDGLLNKSSLEILADMANSVDDRNLSTRSEEIEINDSTMRLTECSYEDSNLNDNVKAVDKTVWNFHESLSYSDKNFNKELLNGNKHLEDTGETSMEESASKIMEGALNTEDHLLIENVHKANFSPKDSSRVEIHLINGQDPAKTFPAVAKDCEVHTSMEIFSELEENQSGDKNFNEKSLKQSLRNEKHDIFTKNIHKPNILNNESLREEVKFNSYKNCVDLIHNQEHDKPVPSLGEEDENTSMELFCEYENDLLKENQYENNIFKKNVLKESSSNMLEGALQHEKNNDILIESEHKANDLRNESSIEEKAFNPRQDRSEIKNQEQTKRVLAFGVEKELSTSMELLCESKNELLKENQLNNKNLVRENVLTQTTSKSMVEGAFKNEKRLILNSNIKDLYHETEDVVNFESEIASEVGIEEKVDDIQVEKSRQQRLENEVSFDQFKEGIERALDTSRFTKYFEDDSMISASKKNEGVSKIVNEQTIIENDETPTERCQKSTPIAIEAVRDSDEVHKDLNQVEVQHFQEDASKCNPRKSGKSNKFPKEPMQVAVQDILVENIEEELLNEKLGGNILDDKMEEDILNEKLDEEISDEKIEDEILNEKLEEEILDEDILSDKLKEENLGEKMEEELIANEISENLPETVQSKELKDNEPNLIAVEDLPQSEMQTAEFTKYTNLDNESIVCKQIEDSIAAKMLQDDNTSGNSRYKEIVVDDAEIEAESAIDKKVGEPIIDGSLVTNTNPDFSEILSKDTENDLKLSEQVDNVEVCETAECEIYHESNQVALEVEISNEEYVESDDVAMLRDGLKENEYQLDFEHVAVEVEIASDKVEDCSEEMVSTSQCEVDLNSEFNQEPNFIASEVEITNEDVNISAEPYVVAIDTKSIYNEDKLLTSNYKNSEVASESNEFQQDLRQVEIAVGTIQENVRSNSKYESPKEISSDCPSSNYKSLGVACTNQEISRIKANIELAIETIPDNKVPCSKYKNPKVHQEESRQVDIADKRESSKLKKSSSKSKSHRGSSERRHRNEKHKRVENENKIEISQPVNKDKVHAFPPSNYEQSKEVKKIKSDHECDELKEDSVSAKRKSSDVSEKASSERVAKLSKYEKRSRSSKSETEKSKSPEWSPDTMRSSSIVLPKEIQKKFEHIKIYSQKYSGYKKSVPKIDQILKTENLFSGVQRKSPRVDEITSDLKTKVETRPNVIPVENINNKCDLVGRHIDHSKVQTKHSGNVKADVRETSKSAHDKSKKYDSHSSSKRKHDRHSKGDDSSSGKRIRHDSKSKSSDDDKHKRHSSSSSDKPSRKSHHEKTSSDLRKKPLETESLKRKSSMQVSSGDSKSRKLSSSESKSKYSSSSSYSRKSKSKETDAAKRDSTHRTPSKSKEADVFVEKRNRDFRECNTKGSKDGNRFKCEQIEVRNKMGYSEKGLTSLSLPQSEKQYVNNVIEFGEIDKSAMSLDDEKIGDSCPEISNLILLETEELTSSNSNIKESSNLMELESIDEKPVELADISAGVKREEILGQTVNERAKGVEVLKECDENDKVDGESIVNAADSSQEVNREEEENKYDVVNKDTLETLKTLTESFLETLGKKDCAEEEAKPNDKVDDRKELLSASSDMSVCRSIENFKTFTEFMENENNKHVSNKALNFSDIICESDISFGDTLKCDEPSQSQVFGTFESSLCKDNSVYDTGFMHDTTEEIVNESESESQKTANSLKIIESISLNFAPGNICDKRVDEIKVELEDGGDAGDEVGLDHTYIKPKLESPDIPDIVPVISSQMQLGDPIILDEESTPDNSILGVCFNTTRDYSYVENIVNVPSVEHLLLENQFTTSEFGYEFSDVFDGSLELKNISPMKPVDHRLKTPESNGKKEEKIIMLPRYPKTKVKAPPKKSPNS